MRDRLDLVADLILRESGIRVRTTQYPALRSAIARALPDSDVAALLHAADDPVDGRRMIARLIDEVTIKETSFFRDRESLDAIPWQPLLERAQAMGANEVRVWCAACATGEEAYTLALLACEAFASPKPPVRILGTDLSNAALDGARAGRYRERSMRAVAASLRQRYFDDDRVALTVGEPLRSIVHFAQHNLVADAMPPLAEQRFDLIVCRNVLIYFDAETADHVTAGLQSALRPGGTLILGSADVLCGTGRRSANVPAAAAAVAPLRKPLGLARPVDSSNSLDVERRFLDAIGELERGQGLAAASSLRHVLYLDPTFGLAAFALGRAHEATGDPIAARRAYEQALRTIDTTDERHDHLLEQVHLIDVATACRARLATL